MRAAAVNALLVEQLNATQVRHRGASEPPGSSGDENARSGQSKQSRNIPAPPDLSATDPAMQRMYFGGFKEGFLPPEPVEPAPIPPGANESSSPPPPPPPPRVGAAERRSKERESQQQVPQQWHQMEVEDAGFMPVGAFLTNSSSTDTSLSSFGGGRMKAAYEEQQHIMNAVQSRNVSEDVSDVGFPPPPEPPPDYDVEIRSRPEPKGQRIIQQPLASITTLDAADLAAVPPTDVVLRRMAPPPPAADARGQKVRAHSHAMNNFCLFIF